MQLLQEIRQGLSGYELNRLVAIGATQRVLTKHLHKMSKHAVRMGLLFTERAEKTQKVPYGASSAHSVVHGAPKF